MKTLIAAIVTLCMGVPAYAAGVQCGAADAMLTVAKNTYHEVPAFTAVINGAQIIVTVSPEGSWTIFARKDALLCAMADGTGWTVAKSAANLVPNSAPVLPTPALLRNGLLRI